MKWALKEFLKYLLFTHMPLASFPWKEWYSVGFPMIKHVCTDVNIWTQFRFHLIAVFLWACSASILHAYSSTSSSRPPPPSPLGSDCHRKHKHSHRKQQNSKLFPCVVKEERITGGGTRRRWRKWKDVATAKCPATLGVMWLALRTLHKTVLMYLAPSYCSQPLRWPENN